ncbi:MAG: hypothetical protein WBP93_12095 [Pyrinomonadaceae bacterium]
MFIRPELEISRRNELAEKLRQITGWPGLKFDENGVLRPGNEGPAGGSPTARSLLAEALSGRNVIILEDASNSHDVVFCRVIKGRWKSGKENLPPAYVVQIDFADFSHLTGDESALAAFNVGWGVMHEIEHVVHDSADAKRQGEAGECEELINRMRRECGLAERSDYYFTLMPGATRSDFKTKFVRIAFERQTSQSKSKKRYWLIWDAEFVGGVDEQKLLAARL